METEEDTIKMYRKVIGMKMTSWFDSNLGGDYLNIPYKCGVKSRVL